MQKTTRYRIGVLQMQEYSLIVEIPYHWRDDRYTSRQEAEDKIETIINDSVFQKGLKRNGGYSNCSQDFIILETIQYIDNDQQTQ